MHKLRNLNLKIISILSTILLITLCTCYVYAHFGIVIPDKLIVDIGDTINVYVFYGHAFEHEVFPDFSIAVAKVFS